MQSAVNRSVVGSNPTISAFHLSARAVMRTVFIWKHVAIMTVAILPICIFSAVFLSGLPENAGAIPAFLLGSVTASVCHSLWPIYRLE